MQCHSIHHNYTNTISMTAKTAPAIQKTLLTFNVFFREDTTTQTFLPGIVSKDPEHWSFFRSVFTGQKDGRLTLVDKSIETPFHCLLAALFCKQLEEELGMAFKDMTLIVKPMNMKHHGLPPSANTPFGSTADRNHFLQLCFQKIFGRDIRLVTKRNPVFCRDIRITSGDNILYLRFEGGLAYGWQTDDGYVSLLSPKELVDMAESSIRCRNIFTHGYSRNGIFINIDFLTKSNT